MKKFEELKALAEWAMQKEPSMFIETIHVKASDVLALLADREQLRRTLESFATPENITHTVYPKCICKSCFAREALAKSDEVENV